MSSYFDSHFVLSMAILFIGSHSVLLVAILFINSYSVQSIANQFHRWSICSVVSQAAVQMIANMLQQTCFIHRKYFLYVLIIEQWQKYFNYHQGLGILPLKKRKNCDKCRFATKQRIFGVFTIDEILGHRGSLFPACRTLCHLG